jgi:hypothetical protein
MSKTDLPCHTCPDISFADISFAVSLVYQLKYSPRPQHLELIADSDQSMWVTGKIVNALKGSRDLCMSKPIIMQIA